MQIKYEYFKKNPQTEAVIIKGIKAIDAYLVGESTKLPKTN